MGELGAMFNPGMRHEIAERNAKAARREEEGTADPGNLRIDLLSGIAVINLGPGTQDAPADAGDESDEEDTVADESADTSRADDVSSADTRDDARDEVEAREDHPDATKADQGAAPRSGTQTDADPDGDVDQVALDIAQSHSNDEPPA